MLLVHIHKGILEKKEERKGVRVYLLSGVSNFEVNKKGCPAKIWCLRRVGAVGGHIFENKSWL